MNTIEINRLQDTAREVRKWVLRSITEAQSGHPGGSLSCVELLVNLYSRTLRHRPDNPSWEKRDRFILSKGHGVPSLYAVLGLAGYLNIDEMLTLRKLGSRFQGHPDSRFIPSLEASTGSLGQGLSIGLGMALGARIDGLDFHVFVLLGDGECNEGQVWEAAMYAGYRNTSNLTAIVDVNHFQLDDATGRILDMEPFSAKWESFGWHAISIDGHDFQQIDEALTEARRHDKPVVILADTVKGKGISFLEGNNEYHGKAISEEQLILALAELDGSHG